MGIYARHNDEWYRVDEGGSAGELPGLGGWANITDVSAPSGIKYTYTESETGTSWVAYEFRSDGTITIQEQGLMDAIVTGAGQNHPYGNGGDVNQGTDLFEEGNHDVTVGITTSGFGGTSFITSQSTGKNELISRGGGGAKDQKAHAGCVGRHDRFKRAGKTQKPVMSGAGRAGADEKNEEHQHRRAERIF